MTKHALLLSSLLPLVACAEGGGDERPQSEVKIAAAHHMFGLRALRAFTSLPVIAGQVFPDVSVWNLFDDSTYTVTRGTVTSPSDRYALEKNGALSVFVSGSSREPTVVFLGAYGLQGVSNVFFFTDRAVTQSSPSIGMFFGVREEPGQADLQGDWNLHSLHLMLDQSFPTPDNVARTAHGPLTAAAGSPGDELVLTGTGIESTSKALDFTGKVQALNGGEANLTVGYGTQGVAGSNDDRIFVAASGPNVLLALDEDETDGEVGILALVRRHGTATPAEEAKLAGTYLAGALTAFVNPNNPGTDAAVGTLEFTEQGAFKLAIFGVGGADETFQGTYVLDPDGTLTITVAVPGGQGDETWMGTVDPDYNTVVLADVEVETRSDNMPQLNFVLALREKPDTP